MHFIYYGSHIVWLLLGYLIYGLSTNQKNKPNTRSKSSIVIGMILCTVFIYARFIEPQLILVHTTSIPSPVNSKIIVISDLHLGIYKGPNFLKRVVDTINQIPDAKAVLIAGDFTLTSDRDADFESWFAPLKEIHLPVYAVLGNHDLGNPGIDFGDRLRQALVHNRVVMVENTSLHIPQTNLTLLGLGEHWSFDDKVTLLNNFSSKTHHLIVLTHNPDTVSLYPSQPEILTIAGHTHGGQIRIPFLYQSMIPCKYDFDKGLSYFKHHRVFVTSGLGESSIPLRLFNPPVIDVLEF